MSIRRKSNNDTIPKRDITIADETCIFVNTEQSVVLTNPDLPEAKKLRSWYVIARKLSPTCLALDSIRGYISFIKPAQATWYRACKTCNKKVTEALGFGYWCEACHKNDEECNLS
nr:replication protein a 70 kda dna-binding subunit b [Quercus suber]